MIGYAEGAMHEYQHKISTRPHHVQHKQERPYYGAKTQWAENESDKPIPPPEDRKYIKRW